MQPFELGTIDVARILGKSSRCVTRLILSGQLPAIKAGRTFRVMESDLRDYIERSRVVVPPSQYSDAIGQQHFEFDSATDQPPCATDIDPSPQYPT
jgi:excisionase family DNA binding protein